jgi:hypothetical protein
MICCKKIMMMCALSATVFVCTMEKSFADQTKDKRMSLIDAKIIVLENERSEKRNALVRRYGDSTMEYRMASKNTLSGIDQKIEQLKREKEVVLLSQL